jgi:hypothetical protein
MKAISLTIVLLVIINSLTTAQYRGKDWAFHLVMVTVRLQSYS